MHLPSLQAGERIQAFEQGVAALERAAAGILAELAQPDSDQGGGQQQQELAQRLQAALDGLSQEHTTVRRSLNTVCNSDPAQPTVLLKQLLRPAAELAAAVQAYFELPEQQAAARLELARIAATRSCAYLRCANLEGGSGRGRTCSACKAVKYCGTACSHADWRAGHKRVCKALAAEVGGEQC